MNRPQQPDGPRKPARDGTAWGLILCVSVTLFASAPGCSYYGNALCSAVSPYEQIGCDGITEMRARLRARKIWLSKYASCYAKHCNVKDIRTGFVDGFVDTCMGGDGCPPLFAPNNGCSLGLRDACAAAWFQGYPLGVAAAESCGCSNRLRTGRINPAFFTCQPGCNAGCEPCLNAADSCSTCGQPEAQCGCVGAHSSTPLPLQEIDMVQPQMIESMPTVAPGETIIPGSFEIQTEENLNSPSDEAPVALPTPDLSAKADANQMIESAIEAEGNAPPLMVHPTNPVVWEVQPFSASSTGQVNSVSIRTAVNSH